MSKRRDLERERFEDGCRTQEQRLLKSIEG